MKVFWKTCGLVQALLVSSGCDTVLKKHVISSREEIFKNIIFKEYCKTEEDIATEIGVKYNKSYSEIRFINSGYCSTDLHRKSIQKEISNVLLANKYDTIGINKFIICNHNNLVLARPFRFHLCNGLLYASVENDTNKHVQKESDMMLSISQPFIVNDTLKAFYYEMHNKSIYLAGIEIMNFSDSNSPKICIDYPISFYSK